jgi:hypothetical protein
VDGQEYFFTDHDEDIVFEGDTYSAQTGYNRTSLSNNVGLSVDNLDVEGVFNTDDITEVDLRAGLFDYAEIKISLVNWTDLSQGELKQRRGRLGEVVVTQQGMFRAELRGLAQQLSQNVIEVYQAECRADLGDSKCKVKIYPEILGREQTVQVGDTFRVPTGTTTEITFDNLVVNGSFERDTAAAPISSITGWTIVTSPVNVVTTDDGLAPQDGSNYLRGGDGTAFEVRQDIPLENTFGASLTQIDASNFTADFSCYRANNAVDDTGRVLVQFLDYLSNPLGVLYDSTEEEITPVDTWVQKSVSGVAVPTGTRFIRIRFLGTRVTGLELNSCIDNVTLSMTDTASTNSYQEIYEDRIYVVTGAGTTNPVQPTYDTTVGQTTTEDGIAPTGTVELTSGASGSVDGITVDGVQIMSGAESFDADLDTTAANVAANITAHTSSPNYTATALGSLITITADDESATPNGFEVISSTTTIAATDVDMADGVTGCSLICVDSFMRDAVIAEVEDQKTFKISVSDARAVDDWFNGGAAIFETGLNTGIVAEIRDWDATTNLLTVFLPLPFSVFNGTKIRLYPGCDKRLATCVARFDNVLNFRGEPFVPGQDELTNYPDAR